MDFLTDSFIPAYASGQAVGLDKNSMIIGGSILYLKPDESWPTCATCTHPLVPLIQLNVSSESTPPAFRTLIPSVVPAGADLATTIQLFVCPDVDNDCYNTSTTYSTDTRSWIVRIATVPLVPPPGSALHTEAKKKIENGPGFLPLRLVETWTPGKKETLHHELHWGQDDSEEFYAIHEPEFGLKLLGHSVRGKYYCSDDDCPQAGPHAHPSRRELIQLGDRFNCEWDEDEALEIMSTLGNTWIEQCVDHPEVLTLTMSGNW